MGIVGVAAIQVYSKTQKQKQQRLADEVRRADEEIIRLADEKRLADKNELQLKQQKHVDASLQSAVKNRQYIANFLTERQAINDIVTAAGKVKHPNLVILVAGNAQAGKSSIINALTMTDHMVHNNQQERLIFPKCVMDTDNNLIVETIGLTIDQDRFNGFKSFKKVVTALLTNNITIDLILYVFNRQRIQDQYYEYIDLMDRLLPTNVPVLGVKTGNDGDSDGREKTEEDQKMGENMQKEIEPRQLIGFLSGCFKKLNKTKTTSQTTCDSLTDLRNISGHELRRKISDFKQERSEIIPQFNLDIL